MAFGRCECNPCEHDCAQPAKLREENARLRQRVEELEGESRVLIGCPCWCHTGDGPEPHGDCRECVRGTSTPTRIERDHTEALWQEKWKAALDLMASQAERADAAEAKLAKVVEAAEQMVMAAGLAEPATRRYAAENLMAALAAAKGE